MPLPGRNTTCDLGRYHGDSLPANWSSRPALVNTRLELAALREENLGCMALALIVNGVVIAYRRQEKSVWKSLIRIMAIGKKV